MAANDAIETKVSEIQAPILQNQTIQKVAFTEQQSANDAIYSVQQKTESVLSSVQNSTIRASLTKKFAPYPDEITAITAYMNKDRNEALRLKKLALTIV